MLGASDNLYLSDVHLLKLKDPCDVVRILDGNEIYTTEFSVSCPESLIRNLQKRREFTRRVNDVGTDEDGDMVVPRSGKASGRLDPDAGLIAFCIHHSMDTALASVGLQVWMGALLMVDFILDRTELFENKDVLELGGGSGLPSLVAGLVGNSVTVTDVGDAVLRLCEMNYQANSGVLRCMEESFRVMELDWTQCNDGQLQNLRFDHIIACDVIYDNDITDAFFRTLHMLLCKNGTEGIKVIISLERRLNFTIDDLKVTCKEYDHFQACLKHLKSLIGSLCIEQIQLNSISQHSSYLRTPQLELWVLHVPEIKTQPSDKSYDQVSQKD